MGWVISILISESFNKTRIDKKTEFANITANISLKFDNDIHFVVL